MSTVKKIIQSLYYKRIKGNKGFYVCDEDWDNLIILDACRFDMFEKAINFEGKLEMRMSRGSCTNEFLLENFEGRELFDTVYVTANPLVNYYVPNSFLEVIPVWKDGWFEEYGTVLPETMFDYALEASENFPDKKLVIHFMQPHYPFVGIETREKVGEHEGYKSRNLFIGSQKTDHGTQEIWNLFKSGKVDKQTVWDAYMDNLEIVLKSVEKLVKLVKGKTVITSDHGNLFGEYLFPFPVKEYGHPRGIYHKNLIKVPWFVIESDERKKVQISKSLQNSKYEEDVMKEKLEALGYY